MAESFLGIFDTALINAVEEDSLTAFSLAPFDYYLAAFGVDYTRLGVENRDILDRLQGREVPLSAVAIELPSGSLGQFYWLAVIDGNIDLNLLGAKLTTDGGAATYYRLTEPNGLGELIWRIVVTSIDGTQEVQDRLQLASEDFEVIAFRATAGPVEETFPSILNFLPGDQQTLDLAGAFAGRYQFAAQVLQLATEAGQTELIAQARVTTPLIEQTRQFSESINNDTQQLLERIIRVETKIDTLLECACPIVQKSCNRVDLGSVGQAMTFMVRTLCELRDVLAPDKFPALTGTDSNSPSVIDYVEFLSDLTRRVGYDVSVLAAQCGAFEALGSVQDGQTFIRGLIGFGDGLVINTDPVLGDTLACTIGEALQESLDRNSGPSVVVQGLEVPALRTDQLRIFWAETGQRRVLSHTQIPSPAFGLTFADILTALPTRITGDYLGVIRLQNLEKIYCWSSSDAQAQFDAQALATLSSSPIEDESFASTRNPSRAPKVSAGRTMRPIYADLYLAGNPPQTQQRLR